MAIFIIDLFTEYYHNWSVNNLVYKVWKMLISQTPKGHRQPNSTKPEDSVINYLEKQQILIFKKTAKFGYFYLKKGLQN